MQERRENNKIKSLWASPRGARATSAGITVPRLNEDWTETVYVLMRLMDATQVAKWHELSERRSGISRVRSQATLEAVTIEGE